MDERVYQILFQWKLEDEVVTGEMPIRDDDIFNVGKIAGLFQPRTYGKTSIGSIAFTQSHIVNGKQRSERGLMNMDNESHQFVQEDHDEYPDDIDTEASERLRNGYVPEGKEPVGYVRYDTPLFDNEGNVLWDNVLPEPPTDGTPYINYYGEKYLYHEELFDKETPLTIDVYKLLLECVLRIRHDGPTLKGFFDITRILGDGYIYDLEIVPTEMWYTVHYKLDPDAVVLNRERRFAAWEFICAQKFKLFKLIEDI
jgi:hypothetical protein